MSLRYRKRIQMMWPMHEKVFEFLSCCIGWTILFAFDVALFSIGHKWSELRADSRRIWR